MQTWIHNQNIQRGVCGACKSRPATWTLTGGVPHIGQVKTDLCPDCLKLFDIPRWSVAAERRIMQEFTKIVEEAECKSN